MKNTTTKNHADPHKKASKFLSLVLRHQPELIHLDMDEQGWVSVDQLIKNARGRVFLDRDLIRRIVRDNDKQRFVLSDDGRSIRANQGHSINIDLQLEPRQPPETLYHGTADRFLESIEAQGLKPGSRRHVHLSADIKTARNVGQRHGRPIVLKVAAEQMYQQGCVFYRSDNGVWLIDQVPVGYLSKIDDVQ